MTSISIAAFGDLLIWPIQIAAAKRNNDVYSFDSMFEEVAPYFSASDLVIGNLETTLAGREETYMHRENPQRWPAFNCPDELAPALKAAGVQVLTTANNHALDRGPEGLVRTLDILDQHSIGHTGTYRTPDEDRYLILEVSGIRVGILAATYGANQDPDPPGEKWMMDRLGPGIPDRIRELKAKADLIVFCPHFGVEFQTFPTLNQRNLTQTWFEHGADIILGCHPHVLQPIRSAYVADRDGIQKHRIAIYSLGNFTSVEMNKHPLTLIGVILQIQATRRPDGVVEVSGIDYVPTWINAQNSPRGRYRVLPARQHRSMLMAEERTAMEWACAYADVHMRAFR